VPPSSLLGGKIAGIGLAGLAQFLAVMAAATFMPLRTCLVSVPAWQVAAAIILMLAAIYGLFRACPLDSRRYVWVGPGGPEPGCTNSLSAGNRQGAHRGLYKVVDDHLRPIHQTSLEAHRLQCRPVHWHPLVVIFKEQRHSVGVHDAEDVGKRPVRLGNKMLSCWT
jgi:hypothetical protein